MDIPVNERAVGRFLSRPPPPAHCPHPPLPHNTPNTPWLTPSNPKQTDYVEFCEKPPSFSTKGVETKLSSCDKNTTNTTRILPTWQGHHYYKDVITMTRTPSLQRYHHHDKNIITIRISSPWQVIITTRIYIITMTRISWPWQGHHHYKNIMTMTRILSPWQGHRHYTDIYHHHKRNIMTMTRTSYLQGYHHHDKNVMTMTGASSIRGYISPLWQEYHDRDKGNINMKI